MKNIDIVIVGAGSAGCILANNIINSTNYNVLLIEAGPKDNSLIIDIPLGYGMTFYNKKINWNFYSKKQSNLFDREIYYPRGKVLGGSSSINGMVYARGLDSDYEEWIKNSNFTLDDIKKSFREIEQNINADTTISGTVYLELDANDEVQVARRVGQTGSHSLYMPHGSFFGHLIG